MVEISILRHSHILGQQFHVIDRADSPHQLVHALSIVVLVSPECEHAVCSWRLLGVKFKSRAERASPAYGHDQISSLCIQQI
jgi:hypothetical protein